MITQAELKHFLKYDPDTGLFTWNTSHNTKLKVGAIAGGLDGEGYHRVMLNGKHYKGHRLAWLYVHGVMPDCEIDHINRNPSDNRIDNLRLADRHLNTQNCGIRKDSTSGFAGVSFYKPTGKWKAQISVNKQKRHLGYFDTPEEAHRVYVEAKEAAIAADKEKNK